MFVNTYYVYLALLSTSLLNCVCYVNYQQFLGFKGKKPSEYKNNTYIQALLGNIVKDSGQNDETTDTTSDFVINPTLSVTINANEPKPTRVANNGNVINFTTALNEILQISIEEENRTRKPKIKIKEFQKQCPENEQPQSIGTFMIPTERDLVFFTQRTLIKMFNSYHKKTLLLLKDIKEATRATVAVEKKCHGKDRPLYRKCVKEINKKCVTITKDLVVSLERQEAEVIALTEDKICNMTSMTTDPLQLIKILAMDEATLNFALPAFLRLLGSCAGHCNNPTPPDHRPRLRHLSDQDLVVKYFLTRKNYMQLLKDNHMHV